MEQTAAERTAAAVRAELARRRITGRALARELSWGHSFVNRRLLGITPFRVDELHAVAAHLGVAVTDLMPVAEDAA